MKSLQSKYNLITEGKGSKDVFIKQAKAEFPQYISNVMTYDQIVNSLKERAIINEKQETVKQPVDWFKTFKGHLNEEKVPKEIEDLETKTFDYKDRKNPDNIASGEFYKGFYVEMEDPKNDSKTVEQLKAIVNKNLAKDPLYYVKSSQFGLKGLGYQEDTPGLRTAKEVKGNFKSSGYGKILETKTVREDESESYDNMYGVDGEAENEAIGERQKTYAVYELYLGQPYNFYNEEKNKFIWSKPKEATLYTKEGAELKRRELLKPRVAYYQRTGNNYNEIYIGDLYKKNILRDLKESPLRKKTTSLGKSNLTEAVKLKIQKYLQEMDKKSEATALRFKLDEITVKIEELNKKLTMTESEDLQDIVDRKAVKTIKKNIALLEKKKKIWEKAYTKHDKSYKTEEQLISGEDGFSDMVSANLQRDPDYQTWKNEKPLDTGNIQEVKSTKLLDLLK